jgi:hypothetical protein
MLLVKFLLSRINGDAPRASKIGGGVWMSTRAGRKQFQKPLRKSTRTRAFAADRYNEAYLVSKLLLTFPEFPGKRKNFILCP